ncbi:hypothetical protein PHYBLDRAFT_167230 [Phycomyces blakesleeanus NRRL 1555(-)]|uniref:Uncharacterized protein n=1 Tax=Phycomyces blakesleeanus (strain ATCC 8743b / DSM 1359 / FGSC 10004 / NBRC 33097 / NRRL 1555) TaxID=763407 RepID=A0A162XHB8_PHYB8|nr:hypothetical protein PHYBLDRAFT_167230 [Phycomyces blakesleeanus NRRL 1555(-)]OAD74895.1 hypothetical protein PHYBLDRAFT_167230 [Phycomyces blakesleeanus NRRL 1555(-)]|eukprot:XP_018292935.1 hypothetical protein PHYBLDRAFT_167230 [Phycomyces blakesleeanus NRRL 1555(-)]
MSRPSRTKINICLATLEEGFARLRAQVENGQPIPTQFLQESPQGVVNHHVHALVEDCVRDIKRPAFYVQPRNWCLSTKMLKRAIQEHLTQGNKNAAHEMYKVAAKLATKLVQSIFIKARTNNTPITTWGAVPDYTKSRLACMLERKANKRNIAFRRFETS